MAQVGDTITYTYSDGSVVSEDISDVNVMEVDYLDGAGGGEYVGNGGDGGRVEQTTVDVSNYDTIYIWVGEGGDANRNANRDSSNGRYGSDEGNASFGGASTEIAFVNTDASDSDDEPFIVGAGGGGSGSYIPDFGGPITAPTSPI